MKVIPNKRAFIKPEPTSKTLDFRRNRKKRDYHKILHGLILALEIAAVTLLAYIIIESFATQVIMTEESMEPQVGVSDSLLIDKVSYRIHSPKAGDVVAFLPYGDLSGRYSIKRVIATPGQKVVIKSGIVYVNNKAYTAPVETTAINDAGLASNTITLGKDEYFVLGDNRDVSEDSRYQNVGNVLGSQIKGKIWFDVSRKNFGVVD
ncbi:MAG: signal peptidase I [Lachnospiraceae bacterium]|uniref:Signal peptidase I n=1 Tax=Candidatus Weimeria bifida TaxID=2599074 RepID=A0A6N7IWD5_9FIRM|nr:signal peptidase I [Candidatus Weimeria bifida]RRF96110.1 MAG: signal peptidase I [Lachnospiraceae bacterium]